MNKLRRLAKECGASVDEGSAVEFANMAQLEAFAAALSCATSAPWHFRRFVDGQEMAEDVMVERATTLEEAVNTAAKICPKRPMTVLVHSCAPTGVMEEPLLLQDENSGRDGRRYNEWHASRPDARRNVREAAEAIAAATPAASAQPVAGWRLVPIEPTEEMMNADWNVTLSDAHTDGGVGRCAWAAMLEAAPAPPPVPADVGMSDDEIASIAVISGMFIPAYDRAPVAHCVSFARAIIAAMKAKGVQ